jgi:hypothetical protein
MGNTGKLPAAVNGGAAVSTPNSGVAPSLSLFHLILAVRLKING